jgi:putative heme transporter
MADISEVSKESFLKRRWKLLLNIVTLIALAGLIVAIHKQLGQTIDNLFKVNAVFLLLIIPIQFLDYDAQARLYKGLFSAVGNKISYRHLFRASLELNFVNHVFPSGGVTGISYFGLRMRGEGVTGAKATVVQLLKLVVTVLSFEILIVFALFCLAIEGHMNSLILLVAGSLTTILVIGTAGFAFIIGSKHRIAGFFTRATRLLNRLINNFRRGDHPETIDTTKVRVLFEDLHENYLLFRKDWRSLRRPFFWGFMTNVWEVLTVYMVYIAFGHFVNIGSVILAYAVANFAGLVSVLPGGVGIYEGLMTLVLTATGVPSRLSLPVTVMYRVLSTLVQIPPGYYLYHRTLRETKPISESA